MDDQPSGNAMGTRGPNSIALFNNKEVLQPMLVHPTAVR